MPETRRVQPESLIQTAAALRDGRLDLLGYLDRLCDRIETLDPELQALLPVPHCRERLREEAGALLARYPDPDSRPPLFGVPVGVKDIFNVDGFETRAGSELPPELFAGPEASSVTALRRAGMLVLGKTVTTEFAYFEPGPTRNPHHPAHTPGGSSSGSAAAVAAGFCPLSLGSQTVGSVIRPAAFCGVAGFKPTYGRIPTDGVLPYAPSMDTVGFFAADAAGLTVAAPFLCRDWQGVPPGLKPFPVLGVPNGRYLEQASPEARAAFERQVKWLEFAGCPVRRVPLFTEIAAVAERHTRAIAAEMAVVHAAWFGQYLALYRPRTAAMLRKGIEVVAQEDQDALQALALVGTTEETLTLFPDDAGLRGDLGDVAERAREDTLRRLVARHRAPADALREEIEALMRQHGIDVWACPAAAGPAPEGLDSTGDPSMNLPWTHTGMPAVTLPAGLAANRLPLGLQIVAPAMADERLLAWSVVLGCLIADPPA